MRQVIKLAVYKYIWQAASDDFNVSDSVEYPIKDKDAVVHDIIEVEIEFKTLDEQQVRLQIIEGLAADREATLAEAMRKAQEIDDKIQQLMALPVDVAEVL